MAVNSAVPIRRPADNVVCATCGARVDPYHPADARVGLHRVKDVTATADAQRRFVITHCWQRKGQGWGWKGL